eukprot:TRINITY_DN1016_c0_g1_i8.p1 TRINITY_DN1016_c0_g1~~TRINITY_DN1016_c0_g1_i8.p1  ORF type:complete len:412 (-),score=120.51 TRINITY_DN1016_c0_g1_i8:13-1248(-)
MRGIHAFENYDKVEMDKGDIEFVESMTQLFKKEPSYLGLLNPSLSPPQLLYLLSSFKREDLREIVQILNPSARERNKEKRRAIFHYFCPGKYPKEKELVGLDQHFLDNIYKMMGPGVPKQFVSYFNRKVKDYTLMQKLHQEKYLDIVTLLRLCGGSPGKKRKTENIESIMEFLRPTRSNTIKRNESDQEHTEIIASNEKEVESGNGQINEDTGNGVVDRERTNKKRRGTDMVKEDVKESGEVWEGFKKKKLDEIEQGIINKSTLMEKTKRELEEKENEVVDRERAHKKRRGTDMAQDVSEPSNEMKRRKEGVKEAGERWEGFKRKKLDEIEQSIINKSALMEQTKREIEEKEKQIELLTVTLKESTELQSYSNTILTKLKERYDLHQKNRFVTPFDFEGEYRQLQQQILNK